MKVSLTPSARDSYQYQEVYA